MAHSLVLQPPASPFALGRWLTSGQILWFGFQSVVLAAILVWSWLIDAPRFSLLWQDSLGVTMIIQAGLLLLANFLMLTLGCIFLNRVIGLVHSVPYCILSACLYGACFIFLYLPILWVVRLGPAAIQITRTLML